jgi:spore maturation protein CgeB
MDLMLAYRLSNIDQYTLFGARKVDLMRSWYLPEVHRKIDLNDNDTRKYKSEVVFIGHYEEDGRAEILNMLAESGINIRIYGPTGPSKKNGWSNIVTKFKYLNNLEIRYVKDDDYVKALNASQIALCFLSKLNNDSYTRRCFEIPACGTPLFSEYTEDLASLFEDGVNIVLFRDKLDLLNKVKYYLSNPYELATIGRNGTKLMLSAGHDVNSRAAWLVNKYNLLTQPGM